MTKKAENQTAVETEAPQTAIEEYSRTAAALATLRHKYENVVWDVTTKPGMEVAIKARAELRTYYVDLEKLRVKLKAPALERTRLIDAEAKQLSAELHALHDPIDDTIKAEQTRKEREKAEKEAAELARVTEIERRIAEIAAIPAQYVGKPSDKIDPNLANAHMPAIWAQEFQARAEATILHTFQTLQQLRDGAKATEEAAAAEAKRIAEERAELARLRAEQDERDRTERARIARETRERAEAEAAARAKIEAEERASRERIEAEERAARLAREDAFRAARAEMEAAAAKAKAEQDAKDEQDRQERAARKAEDDRIAQEQAERDRALRAEAAALEEGRREVARLQAELDDGATILRKFVERFGRRREFSAVTKAITAYLGLKA